MIEGLIERLAKLGTLQITLSDGPTWGVRLVRGGREHAISSGSLPRALAALVRLVAAT